VRSPRGASWSSARTIGFDLALEHASPVAIPGTDGHVDVASLAAIVVLKMVAWLDRPNERERDVRDLGRVFETALDDWDDRRWQAPLADLEHEVQAAFFVGQQVRGIVRASHRVEVETFLERVATDGWLSILGAGGLVCTDPALVAQRRLAAFGDGLG
jgi:predicted nucleotidyltransferase